MNNQLVSFIDLAPTVLSIAGVPIPLHMQGRVLFGPAAAPAPQLLFAARDRMDVEYDMMRSARDERYLYIHNFQPELPYVGFIPFRNESPIMQELVRMQAEGPLKRPARSGCGARGRRRSCTTPRRIRIRCTISRLIPRIAPCSSGCARRWTTG